MSIHFTIYVHKELTNKKVVDFWTGENMFLRIYVSTRVLKAYLLTNSNEASAL